MCYDDNARPPEPPGATAPARGEEIVLTAEDGNRFAAYFATPSGAPTAQVLILPDVRGLHQFYKELALRFAETGVAALALDYFGRTAGLTGRDESFEFWPHVQQITQPTFYADVTAALAHLRANGGEGLARFTVGFCLGGTLSFLCGTQDLDLTGVIGFYAGLTRSLGGAPRLIDVADTIRRPALGLFGGADQGIPVDEVEAFDNALDRSGVPHQVEVYPGAPHSFFDRRATEFADASADAWQQVLRFIESQAVSLKS